MQKWVKNSWIRSGLFYKSIEYVQMGGNVLQVTHKLNFISYHLIKQIHGQKQLEKIANKYTYEENSLNV